MAAAAFVWLWPLAASAKPCDNPARITGAKECLVVRALPSPGELSSPVLVVVMHGDVSSGGPAKYHMDFARKVAEQSKNLVAPNTKLGLAEDYVALLKKRGVDARFVAVPGADHNAAWFGPAVMDAVTELNR